MSASAVTTEELRARALRDEPEQVQDAEPDGGAPDEGEGEAEVDTFRASRAVRIQRVTILSLLVAVQLAWTAALAYGIHVLVT